jgi:hypothetical protein
MLLLLLAGAPAAGAAKSKDWPPIEDLPDWMFEEPDWPPKHFHDDDEALIILT